MSTITVGDQIVNQETGEVIPFPAGVDKLEWLISQIVEAGRQESLWKGRKGMLNAAAGALLEEMGTKSHKGESGSVGFRLREFVRREALPDVQNEYEIPDELLNALIISSAETLNAKRLREAIQSLGLPPELTEKLIYTSTWVQATPARKAAPEKEYTNA